jgi:hypothetical protein
MTGFTGFTAVSGVTAALWALHIGRVVSYTAAGAVVAASVSVLADWSEALHWLRPFWAMLHLAALALGLFLLLTGRQPKWMARMGQGGLRPLPEGTQPVTFSKRLAGPSQAGLFGLAWAAWPCGLLQSALLVAALASTPTEGAGVMAAFALASAMGLWWGPWIWLKLSQAAPGRLADLGQPTWAIRAAGALLTAASGWALGHGLWMRYGSLFC